MVLQFDKRIGINTYSRFHLCQNSPQVFLKPDGIRGNGQGFRSQSWGRLLVSDYETKTFRSFLFSEQLRGSVPLNPKLDLGISNSKLQIQELVAGFDNSGCGGNVNLGNDSFCFGLARLVLILVF